MYSKNGFISINAVPEYLLNQGRQLLPDPAVVRSAQFMLFDVPRTGHVEVCFICIETGDQKQPWIWKPITAVVMSGAMPAIV